MRNPHLSDCAEWLAPRLPDALRMPRPPDAAAAGVCKECGRAVPWRAWQTNGKEHVLMCPECLALLQKNPLFAGARQKNGGLGLLGAPGLAWVIAEDGEMLVASKPAVEGRKFKQKQDDQNRIWAERLSGLRGVTFRVNDAKLDRKGAAGLARDWCRDHGWPAVIAVSSNQYYGYIFKRLRLSHGDDRIYVADANPPRIEDLRVPDDEQALCLAAANEILSRSYSDLPAKGPKAKQSDIAKHAVQQVSQLLRPVIDVGCGMQPALAAPGVPSLSPLLARLPPIGAFERRRSMGFRWQKTIRQAIEARTAKPSAPRRRAALPPVTQPHQENISKEIS